MVVEGRDLGLRLGGLLVELIPVVIERGSLGFKTSNRFIGDHGSRKGAYVDS